VGCTSRIAGIGVPGRKELGKKAPGKRVLDRRVPGKKVLDRRAPGRMVLGSSAADKRVVGRIAGTVVVGTHKLPSCTSVGRWTLDKKAPGTRVVDKKVQGIDRRVVDKPVAGRRAVGSWVVDKLALGKMVADRKAQGLGKTVLDSSGLGKWELDKLVLDKSEPGTVLELDKFEGSSLDRLGSSSLRHSVLQQGRKWENQDQHDTRRSNTLLPNCHSEGCSYTHKTLGMGCTAYGPWLCEGSDCHRMRGCRTCRIRSSGTAPRKSRTPACRPSAPSGTQSSQEETPGSP